MTEAPGRGGTVLLYSGGLDSYAAAVLLGPDVLLHVDTGTRYGQAEIDRLTTPPGMEGRLQRTSLTGLARYERPDDLILPGRNAHLVLLAAQHGDTVWMAATAGDRVRDKDTGFAYRMNWLLEYLYQPQWWLPEGRTVQLALPVKHLTKRELVAAYLTTGADPALLASHTFSCYQPSPGGQPCAACKPCIRKWAALVVHGIDPGFNARPGLAAYVAQVRDGTWDRGPQEGTDVMDAWEATA